MQILPILKSKFQAFHQRFKVCFFMRMVCAILFGIASGMIVEACLPYSQYPTHFIVTICIMSVIYVYVADRFEHSK